MSFVQTGFLIACAAVAIPVLVHLLSRWQVRRIELGTMRFLQEVVRDGAQRRKIRRWLLLLTRAALVAVLALLFARPFLPEQIRRDGDRLRLVMIDRSTSMGMQGAGGRLIDDAIGAAAELNTGLGADAVVQWAWFDRQVHPLPADTTRPTAPRAVTGDTNYLAALSWARDRIAAHPKSLADLVIITDLQQSGLAADALASKGLASDTLQFPSEVPVHLVDVGRPAANNLAITGVTAPATRLETNRAIEFTVMLFNFGTVQHEEVPLTASISNGRRTVRLKKPANVPAGQAAELAFNFGKLEPGTWQLTAALDVADDLAADDRRFAAIEVAEPVEVLVLDSGSGDEGFAAESYYVATALEQSGHTPRRDDRILEGPGLEDQESASGRFRARVVYLKDDVNPLFNPANHSLVVVADAASLSAESIGQLEQYVREGGRLLVFAGDGSGDEASPTQAWEQSGLAPGSLHSPQRSGAMPFRIVSLRTGGTMLQPFEDPQRGDVSRLAFNKLLAVTVDAQTEVLANFDQGRPALTLHPVGKGSVAWFLSSADPSWSNWTTSPLYLPLIQQMAADLVNLTGEGPIRFRSIGDDEFWAPQHGPVAAEATPVALRENANSPQRVIFSQPGFERREHALYVVNGSTKESDPTRIGAEAFAEHFKLRLASATNTVVSASVEGESRKELWPWFAAAVLVLLLMEFALANRTSA